jgi:hypothetical protein
MHLVLEVSFLLALTTHVWPKHATLPKTLQVLACLNVSRRPCPPSYPLHFRRPGFLFDSLHPYPPLICCRYTEDISVQDFTGVKMLPGGANWDWKGPKDGVRLPADSFCKTFQAWDHLLKAAITMESANMTLNEPIRYDACCV